MYLRTHSGVGFFITITAVYSEPHQHKSQDNICTKVHTIPELFFPYHNWYTNIQMSTSVRHNLKSLYRRWKQASFSRVSAQRHHAHPDDNICTSRCVSDLGRKFGTKVHTIPELFFPYHNWYTNIQLSTSVRHNP